MIYTSNYNLLKQLRQTANLSQEDISRKLYISLRQYHNIENGYSIPNVYTALEIAKILKIDPYKLWNIDKKEIES